MLRIAFRTQVKLGCHLVFPIFLHIRILNITFRVAMISERKHQKIFVQTRDEIIEVKTVPFVFRSFIELFVRLQRARQKDNFSCRLSTFEIVKMKLARKFIRYSL
jgi:hypothetical protein